MEWEWKNHDTFTSTKKLQQSTNWEEDIISDDVAKSSISASTGKSVSSAEPFIGLKLGKRTYFENNCARSDAGKKPKSSYCQTSRCQVEGCNLDLSSAKEYHRKHRVCETHSKCPKVVVSGLERRFCQQCSRFHSLAEFDEKKRSCRRRLSDHNARRRKPQQETIHFNSTNLSSTFYGGRQQLSFQSRPAMSSAWENSSASTYSIAKMKTKKSEILDGMPNTPTIAFNRPAPSKGEVSDQGGFKESLSPNVDALGALSLLSNNSWGLFEPTDNLFRLDHPQPMASDNLFMLQHGLQQGLPHDYWQIEQQSIDPDKTSNAQFQEFQLFSRLYSNPMDEILKPL